MERITACNLSDVSNPITHQRSEDGFHIQNQSPELLSEDDMTSPIEKKTGDDGLGIRVECAVCNVRLGAQAMTMHLQGKPHLKKIEHFLMEDSKLSWCPICSVQLSSLKQAFSHCMSKQHCERLVKQQKDITAENTMKRKYKKPDNITGPGVGHIQGVGHFQAHKQAQIQSTLQAQPVRYNQPPPPSNPPMKFVANNGSKAATFTCNFCQVTLNSKKQFDQHNMSPKHINTKNSIQKLVNSSPGGAADASSVYSTPPKRPKFENRNNRGKAPYQNASGRSAARSNRPNPNLIGPRPPPPPPQPPTPTENPFVNIQIPQVSEDALVNPF